MFSKDRDVAFEVLLTLICRMQEQAIDDARTGYRMDRGERASGAMEAADWLKMLGLPESIVHPEPAKPRPVPDRLVELTRIGENGPVFQRGDVMLVMERQSQIVYTLLVNGQVQKREAVAPQSWRKTQTRLMLEAIQLAG
jgi:hypothetical protein